MQIEFGAQKKRSRSIRVVTTSDTNACPCVRDTCWLNMQRKDNESQMQMCSMHPIPTLFSRFTLAPFESKNFTRSICPLWAAWWRALLPICAQGIGTINCINENKTHAVPFLHSREQSCPTTQKCIYNFVLALTPFQQVLLLLYASYNGQKATQTLTTTINGDILLLTICTTPISTKTRPKPRKTSSFSSSGCAPIEMYCATFCRDFCVLRVITDSQEEMWNVIQKCTSYLLWFVLSFSIFCL